jgi:hypothetical protein
MKTLSIFIIVIALSSYVLPLFAQEVDTTAVEGEETQQVIKLEEIVIELEPIKVFTIPRMDAELPPIDFVGVFRYGHLNPDCQFFKLLDDDMRANKVSDFPKMLAKERN